MIVSAHALCVLLTACYFCTAQCIRVLLQTLHCPVFTQLSSERTECSIPQSTVPLQIPRVWPNRRLTFATTKRCSSKGYSLSLHLFSHAVGQPYDYKSKTWLKWHHINSTVSNLSSVCVENYSFVYNGDTNWTKIHNAWQIMMGLWRSERKNLEEGTSEEYITIYRQLKKYTNQLKIEIDFVLMINRWNTEEKQT